MTTPVISAHAMVRFLERGLGMDLSRQRLTALGRGSARDGDVLDEVRYSHPGLIEEVEATHRGAVDEIARIVAHVLVLWHA